MKIIIVRHAIAVDRIDWAKKGKKDSHRPLTKRGVKRMRSQTKSLVQLIPRLDLIASSPLLRSWETAEILHGSYKKAELKSWKALSPKGNPEKVLENLRGLKNTKNIAIVGHEPELGDLLGLMIAGKEKPVAHFKKGGVCLIEFISRPKPGGGQLEWILTPTILRMIFRSEK